MKKTLSVLLAVVLIVAISVAGTLAYLKDTSDPVINTFKSGDLVVDNFVLTEHLIDDAKTEADGTYHLSETETGPSNEYTVIPGVDIPKDPFIEVETSEIAYLFITVDDQLPEDEAGNHPIWKVDNNWEPLKGKGGAPVQLNGKPVYVWKNTEAEADADANILPAGKYTDDKTINIIAEQNITVPGAYDVSKLTTAGKTLSFNAYICQASSFTDAADAWQNNFAPQP